LIRFETILRMRQHEVDQSRHRRCLPADLGYAPIRSHRVTPILTMRQFHFRDRRPLHEIQFAVERELMTLLRPLPESSGLEFQASSKSNGVPYRVLLRLTAALPSTNCYLLQFEAAEHDLSPAPPQSWGKAMDGWVNLWCRDFESAPAPEPGAGNLESALQLAEQARAAEAHLTDVPAVQRAILEALRHGATYATAHKEGGTNIAYQRGRFVRVDYGESPSREEFHDEAAFLAFLRKFYDWETSRSCYPEKIPEYDAWKLILRLLRAK